MARPRTIVGSAMGTLHKDLREHPKVKGQWGKTERIVLLRALEETHGSERLLRLLDHEKIDPNLLQDTLRNMRNKRFTPDVMDGFIGLLDREDIEPEAVPYHVKNYMAWARATKMGARPPKPRWMFWGG